MSTGRKLVHDRSVAEALADPRRARRQPTEADVPATTLSNHCVGRYRERLCADTYMPMARARELIYDKLPGATLSLSCPSWVSSSGGSAVGYLVLDEDVVLPLRWRQGDAKVLVAITCLFRVEERF